MTYLSRFGDIVVPIVELLDAVLPPLLAVVGALGALYCIILGVKCVTAKKPQDREKARNALKNTVIGFVLILVLILALRLLMPVMVNWVNTVGKTNIEVPTASSAASG